MLSLDRLKFGFIILLALTILSCFEVIVCISEFRFLFISGYNTIERFKETWFVVYVIFIFNILHLFIDLAILFQALQFYENKNEELEEIQGETLRNNAKY